MSQQDSAQNSGFVPLVRQLPDGFTPEYCFERLSRLRGCVWLDSCLRSSEFGRYSYLAAEPFSMMRADQTNDRSIEDLASLSAPFFQERIPGLPPFQGGWLGWFGYEFGRCFERIPAAHSNEFRLPVAHLGLYDVVLCWDHAQQSGWAISQGWPANSEKSRQKRAYRRLKSMLRVLDSDVNDVSKRPELHRSLDAQRLVQQHPTRWSDQWTSNFSSAGYRDAVQRCVDYVGDGDIFQVNLSQRLLTRAKSDSATLYQHLRSVNPAPFSGYADLGRTQVISSSPERFLQLQDGQLEARPIKGTRPRLTDPIADHGIAQMLQASEKDISENVMIVDLLRNDMSRVSELNSLRVDRLCGLEKYPFVWHLVSVIRSQLQERSTAFDVVKATFPGGSITGAPKIRAMEIIAELEPTARGPYCGSLGYISFAGDMDLNILIRTITASEGWWQVPVGGGIVADSDPALEEQETWHKAEGILRAIDSLRAE